MISSTNSSPLSKNEDEYLANLDFKKLFIILSPSNFIVFILKSIFSLNLYTGEYPQLFRLIINKRSLGAGRSRNVGISSAKASFIAFLDADDLWKKNKIKLQLNYMIKNKLDICHTSYEILDKKNIKKKVMKAKTFRNYKQLLFSCDIGLSTVMLKKKIITHTCKFPSLKTKEDFVLWLLILKKNITIGSLDKNLTKWRKLNDSLSSSVFQKLKDGYALYSNYMKYNFLTSFWYLVLLSINSLRK